MTDALKDLGFYGGFYVLTCLIPGLVTFSATGDVGLLLVIAVYVPAGVIAMLAMAFCLAILCVWASE